MNQSIVETKQIVLKTNLNGKLACDGFSHLSVAPRSGVPESRLGQIYEFVTMDNSHPPVRAKLLHFNRFPLIYVLDQDTIPSHGVEAHDFVQHFMSELNTTDIYFPMANYVFKKINDGE